MILNEVQKKFVKGKLNKINVLSGVAGTGKSTSLILRMLYAKNNYSFSSDDKILLLSLTNNNYKYIKSFYKNIESKADYKYYTLLSSFSREPYILKLNDVVMKYFQDYLRRNNMHLKLIQDEELEKKIIKECIEIVKDDYRRVKVLKNKSSEFFINEIKWMKNFNYNSLEDYKNSPTHQKLTKKSKAREAIFRLKEVYENKVKDAGYITYEDMLSCAIHEAKLKPEFIHIFIDEGEKITNLQWEFIKALSKEKSYSTINFSFDTNKGESVYSPFIKKGKMYMKNFQKKVKRFNYKNILKDTQNTIEEIKNHNFMEKFQYFDLRHNQEFVMIKEALNSEEVIVNNDNETIEYNKEEVVKIPMFTNIAAGEPILINPSLEDEFSLPKYWLKGLKDCFMLKVKGDSMLNANINDGDYVVINRQIDAMHNDIVAVNILGSATLKRLNINKKGIFLMPENEKYEPIPVNEEGIFILGKAVGIIRTI